MSRARPQPSPPQQTADGLRLLRRLLLLSTLCALALGQTSRGAGAQPPQFGLSVSDKSVTTCPGQTASVRLSVEGPRNDSFQYRWQAAAGRLKGNGPNAFWDLSGVRPGVYAASVTITVSARVAAAQGVTRRASVVVNECRQAPPPSCPDIRLDCPKSADEGERVILTASVEGGGQPREKVTYSWHVSAGAMTGGEGRRIRVDTSGLGGKFVNGRFEARGYGRPCAETCRVFVNPRATPTPTPTPTPTSTPKPTPKPTPFPTPTPFPKPTPFPTSTPFPTPSPTPFVVGTPSPTPFISVGGLTPTPTPNASPTPGASPTPTPAATPSPGASPSVADTNTNAGANAVAAPTPTPADGDTFLAPARSRWPTILVVVLLALAALAALAFALTRLRAGSPTGPSRLPTPPAQIDRPRGAEVKEATTDDDGGTLVGGGTRETDDLHCTVYAPFEAAPGDGFLVQAFAHLVEHAPQLAARAREAQRDAERRGAKGLGAVARGQELGFHLQAPGLEVDEPSQSIVWRGEIETVQFGVNVPETFPARAVNCKLTVTGGSVPLGHLRFAFNVKAAPRPAPAETPLGTHGDFKRYRQAFISYASADRAEVLKRVQMLDRLRIPYFQDLLSIEPGERWEEQIYRYIDASDVFYLFWSSAAKRSVWVEKEVQYALRRQGGSHDAPPEIVPVIIEGPPPVAPPPYLAAVHFNDKILYFIEAEKDVSREP